MSTITVSRDGTSVDFEAEAEGGATTVIETTGKPKQELQTVSRVDPRVSDQFAAVRKLIVSGYIDGTSAYEDARQLAEDLIKPHSGGTPLSLDLSSVDGFGTVDVAPASGSALELEYRPGERRFVQVSLNATQVDETIGGAASSDQTGTSVTPNDGGSVTITNPGTGDSVTLTHDLSVTRTVGRPNTTVRSDPDGVTFIDKNRSAEDVFEISGELISDTARADAERLIDILSASRGRDGVELSFDNNLYGLGTYNVAAVGSEAGRRVVSASEPGVVTMQNITLRTITI